MLTPSSSTVENHTELAPPQEGLSLRPVHSPRGLPSVMHMAILDVPGIKALLP